MRKYTLGDWQVGIALDIEGGISYYLKNCRENIPEEEIQANRDLIACAPELIEILTEVLNERLVSGPLHRRVSMVIAKASGTVFVKKS